jgi:sodium-dependent dicarboxylate transporter 2/3/5
LNSETESSEVAQSVKTYQRIGRAAGPVIFVVMLAAESAQNTMSPEAWRVASVGLWMAIWWATEAIPVFATALLPIVAFAPLGVVTMREATAPYANPVIFLFFGGFLMALALEKWNLHRRIALEILVRIGTDGQRLVGGFMIVCAMLSMWMTNTSTTIMLLPIILSVSAVICENTGNLSDLDRQNFRIAMLLGLAYSASIGGLATLIGTPPNALLVGFMADNYGVEISFARWMTIGIPLTFILLPITWVVLTRWVFPVNIPANDAARAHLDEMRLELGSLTTAEKRVALIFLGVVTCWMLRRPVTEWLGLTGVSDTGIVMTAAVLLFMVPSSNREAAQLLAWSDVARLPWGVLVLFGGGLSLAAAVSNSGLALLIFLTELTSNLATTATLLPVMGAIALQAGVPPVMLTVPITIAASCAFMLPVATPPNAIVFATGEIRIPQMVRAGFLLNIIGIVMVTLISLFAAPWLLG